MECSHQVGRPRQVYMLKSPSARAGVWKGRRGARPMCTTRHSSLTMGGATTGWQAGHGVGVGKKGWDIQKGRKGHRCHKEKKNKNA